MAAETAAASTGPILSLCFGNAGCALGVDFFNELLQQHGNPTTIDGKHKSLGKFFHEGGKDKTLECNAMFIDLDDCVLSVVQNGVDRGIINVSGE